MKIEDIEIGQRYYVSFGAGGGTYLVTPLVKDTTKVVCAHMGAYTTLEPQWFVAKAEQPKPQPSLWSRVRSIFSPGFSEP